MMFEGDDRTLQSLTNSGTINVKSQKTPWVALDAISTTIKSEEHFWDELLSDVCQLSSEGIHVLSPYICTLGTNASSPTPQTEEALKIMVLQHAVQYQVYKFITLI